MKWEQDQKFLVYWSLYLWWFGPVVSDSLRLHRLLPTRLLCPWDFLGKNTGVGCHFLLQGIEPRSPVL